MSTPAPPSALELRDLRRDYRGPGGGAVRVVDIPEFRLGAAEACALAGPSGCGKTTLLHLIAGILTPTSGSIRVCGEAMTGLREAARDRLRARHVGYVFQTFHLLQSLTALENVLLAMTFGRGADRGRAEHLLERVGLADRLRYRPRELSIGQQQRVAVARALANRPGLVLADEPTGSLDQPNAAAALELLRSACAEEGAALLLVSHDPGLIARFDRQEDLRTLNRAATHAPETAAP